MDLGFVSWSGTWVWVGGVRFRGVLWFLGFVFFRFGGFL